MCLLWLNRTHKSRARNPSVKLYKGFLPSSLIGSHVIEANYCEWLFIFHEFGLIFTFKSSVTQYFISVNSKIFFH